MRILGIDPGLNITGYGCIDASSPTPRIVEAGVFRLGKSSSASPINARSISARLSELGHDLSELLERLQPGLVAVESLFAHYKHPATAIIMGHARGVLLLAIARAGIPLVELKPNEIKKSLTGHGHADKARMQRAIQRYFSLAAPPKPPDIADALAIALCAAARQGSPLARPEVTKQLASTSATRKLPASRSRRITSRELDQALRGQR